MISSDCSAVQETSDLIQQSDSADYCFVKAKQMNINYTFSYNGQILSQKLVRVVCDAVPGADEFITDTRIKLFLEQLQQKAGLLVEEAIRAIVLLHRFIVKQSAKDIQVLKVSNVGTLIIISFILAMKLNRDKIPNNRFFANMFGIHIFNLNLSEISFLQIIDFETWVEFENHSLFQVVPLINETIIIQ
ncbi:MAG: hypothetical protein EZS28_006164 [Streblomastix strix]|uniref:Cyclin N-terminal domain-containing protein n=1 Tax=Streblomastix strix TaxID=222440 RepID=A0A5J4WT81_9EUKA|nr:MAG: hypothetical protein EZS28_006164 [Streblomastix strix]